MGVAGPSWWCLSFCDTDKPTNEQFLGACIVRAISLESAIVKAYMLSCYPGGEIQNVALDTFEPPPEFVNKLLNRETVDVLLKQALKQKTI